MGLFTSRYMSALENEVSLMLQWFKISTFDEIKERTIEKPSENGMKAEYFVDNKLALTVIYEELKSGRGTKLSLPIPTEFIRHYESEVSCIGD